VTSPISSEAFPQLADLIPAALLLVTGDGVIQAANRAAGERFAIPSDALVGKPLSQFLEDEPDLPNYLRACARSRTLLPSRLSIRRPDALPLVCRAEGAVLRPREADTAALILLRLTPQAAAVKQFKALNERVEALLREVGRRQRAEEALREQREWLRVTLASIGDGVIATDMEGRVTLLNPVAQAYTGWKEVDALGRPLGHVFTFVEEQSRASVESIWGEVLRGGPGAAAKTVLVRPDGAAFTVEASMAPIQREDGTRLGTVLVFHDITERRSLEREIQRRAEQLALADRRKDEFLAMLAHELRNPLAPLRNGVEILRGLPGDPAIEQTGEMMQRQVHHLTRLVDDLLDVSRITHGRIQLRKELVPLATVMEQAIEMVRPLIREHRHELRMVRPPDALLVEGDQLRLAQVFTNLLTNAAKFTPPGGRLDCEGAAEGAWATVRIRDNGAGIPADLLPHIFDLFTQADRSLDRPQGGLGLGLTLVKTIVELHDGAVTAASEGPGRGSEFVVRLPARAGAGAARPGPPPPPAVPASRRVLIVDDNRDSADSLSLLLRHWTHDVRTAYDGPAAIELAKAFRPEFVLLDIGLPGMSGLEVAKAMRQHPDLQDARLIAITGYGREQDRSQSQQAGFNCHLTKPVALDDLKELLTS
jgi:PAS domain S-box-containing protein